MFKCFQIVVSVGGILSGGSRGRNAAGWAPSAGDMGAASGDSREAGSRVGVPSPLPTPTLPILPRGPSFHRRSSNLQGKICPPPKQVLRVRGLTECAGGTLGSPNIALAWLGVQRTDKVGDRWFAMW